MSRNYRIDVLKAVAIVAVVLYHFGGGYLTYGYLGVDIFFVISGYFMMKSISNAMKENRFRYLKYVFGRVARLWPLVLVIGVASLIIGYFCMLPDDLENLSEAVIASNVFANNVLACITTRNYWDVANVFKPLMHTWYVGVLMQAYVLLPLIYLAVYSLAKRHMTSVKITTAVITVLSLLLYLLPVASDAEQFYYLPFRAFEIMIGSMIAFMPKKKIKRVGQYAAEGGCSALIILLLCVNSSFIPPSAKLLTVVMATAVLVYVFVNTEERPTKLIKTVSCIGKASFSIYLCHQVVVAYMFYAVTDRTDIPVLLAFLLVVAVLSAVIYLCIEKPIGNIAKKKTWRILIPSIVLCLITSAASAMIYLSAGVVRDVPELGIDKENVHRGMHAEYVDVPYSWDKDFTDDGRVKIVVIGDSFGRDWANILNESEISDDIEISYIYIRDSYEDYAERLSSADIVFRAFSTSTTEIEDCLPENVPKEKLYIVGYKNFGTSNGIIYSHRNSDNYFEQTITLDDEVLRNNQVLKEKYGSHYIDMIEAVQEEDGSVRVFTDNHYFISQDCRHLTQYGARYYAEVLDFSWILEVSE